ncbi:hypothetical protein [Prosthecobacter sp.]|uniref:hypothetical protein n=1 Tax=Prosthecobacter sp. TaxID=1965333 RepID=UPI0024886629|nr:hypothetical protein [Prosthecobacter sp.]MDI1315228.1 hypothetical protein [Prosthecobacter sp.]
MKSLFYTILIIGGAFLAYDYFGAPPGKKMVFKSLNPPVKPKVVTMKPIEVEKPVIKEMPPEPMKPVAAEKPVEKVPAPTAAPVSSGPKFEPIEALTGNWLKIPSSAFPREVKLVQDAMFKMSVGSSKIAAGGKVYVLAADNGVLTLAPTASSPARAQLAIDGTDLKDQLNAAYEKWKITRAEEIKVIAATKVRAQSEVPAVEAGPSSSEADASGKPVRDSDGGYPLLINSMKRGQITEIKAENITRWQDAQPIVIQGKPGWAVKVECNVKTIFGLQPVEAQALVLNGKITGWYYTGSGEEVP